MKEAVAREEAKVAAGLTDLYKTEAAVAEQ